MLSLCHMVPIMGLQWTLARGLCPSATLSQVEMSICWFLFEDSVKYPVLAAVEMQMQLATLC